MANPFIMRVIPSDYPFANRIQELKELSSHARNKANVVVFAPRRYGKTSLVKKIQANLKQDGFITIYTNFFMVASVDDVAERIARSVYSILHKRESFFQKGARYLKTFKTFRPVFNRGENCSRKNAEIISSKVARYPHYVQSLAYNVYEAAERTAMIPEGMLTY